MRDRMTGLSLALGVLCSLLGQASPVAALEVPRWFRHARVGGLSISPVRTTDFLISDRIDDLVKHGVNVVEGDSRFSDYLTDQEFDEHVDLVKRVTRIAHQKGVPVVWYIPTMEVITADGLVLKKSMARDHPDWIQVGFDRKGRGYFYGQQFFWVEPKDESAWMCPSGPYREYLLGRLKKLASSGVDGLWLDVPVLGVHEAKWGCADSRCRAKFERETGMSFPSRIDLSDPVFYRYVRWRHEMLAQLLAEISRTVRSVNPRILTIPEIVTGDNISASEMGLDATYLPSIEGLETVVEVNSISDSTGMCDGKVDDWLAAFTSYKWARGAAWPSPAWGFTYGWKPPDAQLVMASCLAAQVNPYEVKVPQMCSTVGKPYRKKMFRWVERNTDLIFETASGAEVGLFYSSDSRDLLDGIRSSGNFSTWAKPRRDLLWASTDYTESVRNTRYMAEYRGWAKLLIKSGIPFDIIPVNRVDSSRIGSYRCLILPEAAVLDEKEQRLLLDWVRRGGHLVVAGVESGSYGSDGRPRRGSIWAEWSSAKQDSSHPLDRGTLSFWRGTPGRDTLRKEPAAVQSRARQTLASAGVQTLVPRGEPVYVQLYRGKDVTVLHAAHYGWVGARNSQPTTIPVRFEVPVPPGTSIASVTRSVPGRPDEPVRYVRTGDRAVFESELTINALFVIRQSR